MSKDIIQNKYTAPDKVAGHDGDKLTRRWLKGIPYEIAFWRSFYSNKRRRAKLHSWSSIGKEWRLDGFDVAAFLQSRHIEPDSERCGEAGSVKNHVGDPERRGINFPSPRVLDVGASLSYVVGNVIGGRKYDVEYVDPLAPFYNRILERYNVDLPRISFGMIENLSASYGEESVDLIHVRNALDHCANPARGICECIATLKPGGVLYLHHHRNEAEAENYRGFHQFNIDCKDGRMLIWNAETCIYLDELLAGMADVECFTTPEGFIVGIAKKRAAAATSSEARAFLKDQLALSRKANAKMVSEMMQFLNSFPTIAAYQWSRLYCTLGHYAAKSLPSGALARLKKLLSRKTG